jgi:hypothetical protein
MSRLLCGEDLQLIEVRFVLTFQRHPFEFLIRQVLQ